MQAKRDANYKPVALAISSTDSRVPQMLKVDPVTIRLLVDDTSQAITATTGIHKIDNNSVATCYGVSFYDNKTLVPIRTDSQGRLLIQYPPTGAPSTGD